MKNSAIETITHYGHYTVTGPTTLPVALTDGTTVEFVHKGFKFPQGRYGVLLKGSIESADDILVRVSSNCQWAFYFSSRLCDCKYQMEESQRRIVKKGNGLIIFAHDQNGKGVPLEDHWLIYSEGQKRGLELVVDAYTQIGFKEDYRNYNDVLTILQHYDIKNMTLLTNNPNRITFFKENGITTKVENIEQPLNQNLEQEYQSKKYKLGHLLNLK
ncbi:MAG: hypothetical protein WC916_04840 [Candidatus Woesearchaeota archaeon]